MLPAAVSVLPGPLAHSIVLVVGPVPGELRELVSTLYLHRLVASHLAVRGGHQLGHLDRRPVADAGESLRHEVLLSGPGTAYSEARELFEQVRPVEAGELP